MDRPATSPPTAVPDDKKAAKRSPWVTPRLKRLGSVAKLTAAVDNSGRNDGGKFPKRRT